jgi:hypothetical protein
MIPCSAAIVTGVVCDAVSGPDAGLCLWYSISNEPEPKPWSGRSANSLTPPESTLPLPAETPLKPWLNPNVVGEIATAAAPIKSTMPAISSVRESLQRTAATSPRATSNPAMLERERLSTSATHVTASTPPITNCWRGGRS